MTYRRQLRSQPATRLELMQWDQRVHNRTGGRAAHGLTRRVRSRRSSTPCPPSLSRALHARISATSSARRTPGSCSDTRSARTPDAWLRAPASVATSVPPRSSRTTHPASGHRGDSMARSTRAELPSAVAESAAPPRRSHRCKCTEQAIHYRCQEWTVERWDLQAEMECLLVTRARSTPSLPGGSTGSSWCREPTTRSVMRPGSGMPSDVHGSTAGCAGRSQHPSRDRPEG